MGKISTYYLRTLCFVIQLCIIFSSCEKAIHEQKIDNSPPEVTILFPFNGAKVKGEVVIQARAIDNNEVDFVDFYLNSGKLKRTSNAGTRSELIEQVESASCVSEPICDRDKLLIYGAALAPEFQIQQ